jgi:thiol-disulfide isomerase/thioredoxin
MEKTTLPCLVPAQEQISVAAVHGRPEVISIWASWCSPCRREAPILEAAHQAAGDRILFLGVDTRDTHDAALRFLAESGVTYPQVVDDAGVFVSRLGMPGVPYTLFIDASGRIVYRWVGELTPQRLRDGLSRLEAHRPATG